MGRRVGIVGAGGMGSAFAAFLARAGHDVVLIGRGGAHVRAVAAHGLRVVPPQKEPCHVQPETAVHAAELSDDSLDVLILLTKTYDTAQAAASGAHALKPDGVAVSLQNGLGNDAVLAAEFGPRRSLVGATTVGATVQRPGEVSISALAAERRSITHLGAMGRAGGEDRADDVVEILNASQLPATHARPVAVPVWEKLALAVMSPISAVLGQTVGRVWASADGRALVEQMFDEVVAVAAQQGVGLDRKAAWEHACRVFTDTGEHYTSMCTDVQEKRPTELAYMAGAVSRLAEAGGIPVPVHTTVLRMLGVLGAQ